MFLGDVMTVLLSHVPAILQLVPQLALPPVSQKTQAESHCFSTVLAQSRQELLKERPDGKPHIVGFDLKLFLHPSLLLSLTSSFLPFPLPFSFLSSLSSHHTKGFFVFISELTGSLF